MSQLGNSSVGKLLTGGDMAPGIALPARIETLEKQVAAKARK